MGSYLTTLANAIGGLLSGGGQTVQPIPPLSPSGGPVQGTPSAQSSPATASPPPTGVPSSAPSGGFVQGAENFLGSPLTQAALSSYFAAAGSPRKAGLGGMISRGGLSGLSAYGAAQAAQQKAALQAAQLPQMQAQTAAAQAQTQLSQAKAEQLAGIQQNNQQTAAALRTFAMQPGRTSDQRQAALFISSAIENNTTEAYKPSDLMAAVLTDPAKAQEAFANTALATARMGAVPSTIARNQAETANKAAETAAIPEKLAIEKSKTAKEPAAKDPLDNMTKLAAIWKSEHPLEGMIKSPPPEWVIEKGYDPTTGVKLAPPYPGTDGKMHVKLSDGSTATVTPD